MCCNSVVFIGLFKFYFAQPLYAGAFNIQCWRWGGNGFFVLELINLSCCAYVIACRYSTGLGVTGGSALIHDFYSREVPNPIHLTVDTGFSNGEGTIKAYVSVNLSLGDRPLAAQFQEVPLDLRMVEAERIGCMYISWILLS